MSTFDGIVKEFPDIRIDRFVQGPTHHPPPLCTFLSHVHTDHLVGLDTHRSPFVYCSAATREILLKLETYPNRINFARGILEKRVRRFEHLKTVLKPIPLETPTVIDLAIGRSLRVTLFDANHCVGSVMFLIESGNSAILYTGDIRSEIWWVNSLVRNPLLLPYVVSKQQEPLKRLDAIYLDTTFATKEDPYFAFPTKASGILELLRKVSEYPRDTVFYVDAWTFGYEDVWQALATFLGSSIHVDEYRYGLYKSLSESHDCAAPEAFKLVGGRVGNHYQGGCVSMEQSRIHSCERGSGCDIWTRPFVRITPIISRSPNGAEMAEVGAGGGKDDLTCHCKLDLRDPQICAHLVVLCVRELRDQPSIRDTVLRMLTAASEDQSDGTVTLEVADVLHEQRTVLDADNVESSPTDTLSSKGIVSALAKRAVKATQGMAGHNLTGSDTPYDLAKQITFPYSRHSSYSELCFLVEAFRPRDIVPCTVDSANWDVSRSMAHLFGHIFWEPVCFSHDQFMLQKQNKQGSFQSEADSLREDLRPSSQDRVEQYGPLARERSSSPDRGDCGQKARCGFVKLSSYSQLDEQGGVDLARALQQEAYDAASGNGMNWSAIELVSVAGHQTKEVEL